MAMSVLRAADLVHDKSLIHFLPPSLLCRSRQYAVSPPALLLARSGGRSVEGIALSKQSTQDMVQMIRYELLDIFVSKNKQKGIFFSIAIICPDYSVELCKLNMFTHYFCHAELHLFLNFMAWTRQSGQKSAVCCVVSWEGTLGVQDLASAHGRRPTAVVACPLVGAAPWPLHVPFRDCL